MGMYTELVLKLRIRDDIPEDVKSILDYLFNGDSFPLSQLPNHKFFMTPRWVQIGSCNSFYHVPWCSSQYKDGYLFSRSDLKNYDNEIDLFLEWLDPYIDPVHSDCIGWKWYEEERHPTLLFKGKIK